MAESDLEGEAFVPFWLTCAHRGPDIGTLCIGKRVEGFAYCLAHIGPDQLNQILQRLRPGADLEAPGTYIDAGLLDRILRAVTRGADPATFGSVWLEQACFAGGANFAGIRFRGPSNFSGARFSDGARFDGAQFDAHASFTGAHFKGTASFNGSRFSGPTGFQSARFGQEAKRLSRSFTRYRR
jgi:hypothetical protein